MTVTPQWLLVPSLIGLGLTVGNFTVNESRMKEASTLFSVFMVSEAQPIAPTPHNPHPSTLTPHSSHLTPHTSPHTPHPSPLTPPLSLNLTPTPTQTLPRAIAIGRVGCGDE